MTFWPRSAQARVTLIYIVGAALAVLVADRLVAGATDSLRNLGWFETAIAWLLILLTAPIIYMERRRAEQRGGRLRAIVEASSDAIIGLNLAGVVTSWNQGAERVFGHKASAAVGRPLRELWPAIDAQDPYGWIQPILTSVALGKATELNDLLFRRPDGSRGRVQLSFAPVRTSVDEVVGIALTGRDMTEWRRAERALRMAEMGELASGLVHEIRNPLNAMQMHLALTKRRLQSGSAEGDDPLTGLASLEQEIGQLQELASDFLAYGRPGPERTSLIDLGDALNRLAEFERPEFEEAGCSIRLQPPVDGAEPVVEMDPTKLDGMLRNLLRNAREAMADGGVLTLAWRPTQGHHVCVEVRDTGPGIPGPDPARVFAAFYSTRPEGTGLGLAIVKQIVEAAGGHITVSSEVGRGASFRIYLPTAGTVSVRQDSERSSAREVAGEEY